MILLSRTKRRWKAAADGALSAEGLLAEADRLAAEIAQQVWRSHGGAPWADVLSEGGVLMLQSLTVGMLAPEVVMTSAALRHLSALEHAAASSDYEDVPVVSDELLWVRAFLAPKLAGAPLVDSWSASGLSAAAQHEALRKDLAVTMGQRLKMAIAAA